MHREEIAVSTAWMNHGCYSLLRQPYCGKCSLPGLTTSQCPWHREDTVNRTYALGPYIRYDSDDEDHDLLSKHIRLLKRYRKYSVPLGLGMSLCIEHIYPELLKVDIICPIPKHPDELKVEPETNVRFNPPSEIAIVVTSELGMNLQDAVKKAKPYSQRNADRHARVNIPADVYAHNTEVDVKGRSVLLIDDVRTSGGTFSACTNSLLAKGAKVVNG